jgi:hypothetical protein
VIASSKRALSRSGLPGLKTIFLVKYHGQSPHGCSWGIVVEVRCVKHCYKKNNFHSVDVAFSFLPVDRWRKVAGKNIPKLHRTYRFSQRFMVEKTLNCSEEEIELGDVGLSRPVTLRSRNSGEPLHEAALAGCTSGGI